MIETLVGLDAPVRSAAIRRTDDDGELRAILISIGLFAPTLRERACRHSQHN